MRRPTTRAEGESAGDAAWNVLVIDDDVVMRELLYDLLTRKGYTVLTATSGAQALDLLKAHRPHCLLVDTGMPGASGLETARAVRAFDEQVPIVLLKGAGEADIPAEELQRQRIADVLRKELSVELFVASVERVLKALQQLRQAGNGRAAPLPGALLIVDDEPKIRNLLKGFFESRGLRTLLAASGEEALTVMAQRPLAVLLDVNMPGMDGLMTLRKIKAGHPSVPVIMASGMGEEPLVQAAIEHGAYDYVTKPFNLEYLETVVLTKVLLGMEG